MLQKIRHQETQASIHQERERQTLVQAQIQDELEKSKERERPMKAQIQEEREKNTRRSRAQQTGRIFYLFVEPLTFSCSSQSNSTTNVSS
jgi:hypothetical protein